jgi:hypothetical protein
LWQEVAMTAQEYGVEAIIPALLPDMPTGETRLQGPHR